MQAFEGSASASVNRQQYEAYARKLDARYPLCATCTYRVNQHLQECDKKALQYQRQTLLAPRDPDSITGKLNLASRLQKKRARQQRIEYVLFCLPELVLQSGLLLMAVMKRQLFLDPLQLRVFSLASMLLWLPARWEFVSLSSCVFVVCVVLLATQFCRIVANRRGVASVLMVLFVALSRVLLINQLVAVYQPSRENSSLSLTMAAMGLAVILRTGASGKKASKSTLRSHRQAPISKGPASHPAEGATRLTSQGFARYSDTQHRYHSFANVGEDHRSIQPYPIRPLPGQLVFEKAKLPSSSANKRTFIPSIKPTMLDAFDPIGLEPMFSSFSLDEKENIPTTSNIQRRTATKHERTRPEEPKMPSTRPAASLDWLHLLYNAVLSVGLLVVRWLVHGRVALEAVALAASFSLRGFLWSRLSLPQQMMLLSLAVLRLAFLAAQISEAPCAYLSLLNHSLFASSNLLVDSLLIALR